VTVAGLPHHVVHRGNNRQQVFFEPSDYFLYRSYVKRVADRYACQIHAYVFMTNHVHLLATEAEPRAIPRMIQVIASRYATHINRVRGRTGALWEGRYRASVVDSDRYFLTCQRYIELNPVRASMVTAPAEYRWSSHAHYAFGQYDDLLTEHPLYLELARESGARMQAYRSMFESALGDDEVANIRLALNDNRPLRLAHPRA
jgi:putative transposase